MLGFVSSPERNGGARQRKLFFPQPRVGYGTGVDRACVLS